MKLTDINNMVKDKLSKNTPEILVGVGLVGMLSSTVMAVKATPKALSIIEEEEEYLQRDLTKVEKVKLAWKPYVPAAIGYCVSAGCILGANSVNTKRYAIASGAYKLTETALREYKDKVIEVVGEEKEREISNKTTKSIHKRHQTANVNNTEIIYGTGTYLCFDPISGRYFHSDMDKIRRIENELNYRLMKENMVSLNEFYTELGLECTDMGFRYGWNIDDGLMEVRFTSNITDDNKLCLIVTFASSPRIDFDKWS